VYIRRKIIFRNKEIFILNNTILTLVRDFTNKKIRASEYRQQEMQSEEENSFSHD